MLFPASVLEIGRILSLTNVISGFDQWAQNSLSILGTRQALKLPHFLTSNVGVVLYPRRSVHQANSCPQPLPAGKPWGLKDIHTNYYNDYPYTGVTRYYDWTISKTSCAPDGVNVSCLLVNGEFPGPMIEANWGDTIQVKVTNNLATEGAAIHWHGLLQKGSQPFDGVPGVSQCPIAPGQSFTYVWDAEMYGTSWWHSHYSSQYASGLQGPIVIYGPLNLDYDIDLGPVQINDWYHDDYQNLLAKISVPLSQGPQYPYSQNILINGKNPFTCEYANGLECSDAPMATFNLTAGKTHRLRLINAGADATLKVSLDGHSMQVIANDFVPIQPYITDVVTLSVGQRCDVLVTANQGDGSAAAAYWLRALAPDGCSSNNGQNYARAAVYYDGTDQSSLPTSLPVSGWDDSYCGGDPLSETIPELSLDPGTASTSETIEMSGHSNGTHGKWWMNNVSAVVDYNSPILLKAKVGDLSFPPARNVHAYPSSYNSVRYIVYNRSGNSHPMHFHGHNIFILAEGGAYATWDGTIINPTNPQRRDVQTVVPWGFIVVQWTQDNPGAWPFHCHLAWHLSLGMAIEVLESPDLIPSQVRIPSTVSQTCRDWWTYTGHNDVSQIDSGI